MRRREVPKAVLATTLGSALAVQGAQAQTCSLPCHPQTVAESAAGISPPNPQYPPGDLRRLASAALESLDAAQISDVLAAVLKTAGLALRWSGALAPITLRIGAGGHFNTINEALAPLRRSIRLSQQIRLHLLSGFVMAEEVHAVNGVDLGWIRLTADDAEVTLQRSAITTELGSYSDLGGIAPGNTTKAAFMAINGSTLPMIDALFVYDSSGTSDSKRMGVMIWQNSRVRVAFGAGVKRADGQCLSCHHSIVIGEGSIWDEGGMLCARIGNGSFAHLRKASLRGSGGTNLAAAGNNTITLIDADLTGATNVGLLIGDSLVDAQRANVSNAGTIGLNTSNGAVVHFTGGVASGCGTNGINATGGSIVTAANVTVESNGSAGVVAQHGARVALSGGSVRRNGGSGDLAVYTGGTIIAHTTTTTNGSGEPSWSDTNLRVADAPAWFNEPTTLGVIYGPAGQRTAAEIAIAAAGDVVNTTGKFAGRLIWDTTNNRMLRARGPGATDPWDVVDGSGTVTPL